MGMHWIDWLVVLIPMAIITAIGIKTQRYIQGVSDFLAAGRSANRYLLSVSEGMAGLGLISVVAIFEKIYQSGFAIGWWEGLLVATNLFLSLTGFVVYRYRETRAMTMAQFFELRYSKAFRIYAGVLASISGIINYALFPAVGGRFFVYYCGFPETVRVFGMEFQTFGLVMAAFLSLALLLVSVGGQLTVMVTDCVQGLFGYAMYTVIILALLSIFSWSQISHALMSVPEDKSLLHPFRQSGIEDFNIWYVLINVFGWIYSYMAWQGSQGFNCSAANPHEAKMGKVLGQWRAFSVMVMVTLLAVCAYTYLNHPDFQHGAEVVRARLSTIENPQIQTQMRVSLALAYILPIGVKGIFCAVMLFLLVTTDVSYLHSWGTIVVQDVVLPFRKKPFSPKQQLRYLRLSITGVAVFAFFFSLYYSQTQYILMFFALTGTIYLGGSGAVILGGLYWKKGTTPAAWGAMTVGGVLGVGGLVLQQVWKDLVPTLLRWFPDSSCLANHPTRFPINGQWLWLIAMLVSIATYIVVSLLTCRQDFNMNRMLHRGRYRRPDEAALPEVEKPPRSVKALLGIDEHFTRGDKVLAYAVFAWGMFWLAVFVIATVWNLIRPWPDGWWASYWYVAGLIVPIVMGIVTSVWFTIGGLRDLRRLFRRLRTLERNILDDGRVVDHRNVDEIEPAGSAAQG